MKNRFPQRGAALVVVLSIIILAVVLVVGLTLAMRMERSAAFYNLERARAEGLARIGVDYGKALLMEAATTNRYWVSAPGRITASAVGTNGAPTIPIVLSSGFTNTTNADVAANLNRTSLSAGDRMLDPGGTNFSFRWIYLLKDGSYTDGPGTNTVGRFAFWMDDESARVDMNTAELRNASLPASDPRQISLGALPGLASFAGDIALEAATNAFLTPYEALGRNTNWADALFTNRFFLTHFTQDPDSDPWGRARRVLTTWPTNAPQGRPYFAIRIGTNDPGFLASLSSANVEAVYTNLVSSLVRSDWPYAAGNSFVAKFGASGVVQLGVDLIEYVRAAESTNRFPEPLIATATTNSLVLLPGSTDVNAPALSGAVIGTTRRPMVSQVGVFCSTNTNALGFLGTLRGEISLPPGYQAGTNPPVWLWAEIASSGGGTPSVTTNALGTISNGVTPFAISNVTIPATLPAAIPTNTFVRLALLKSNSSTAITNLLDVAPLTPGQRITLPTGTNLTAHASVNDPRRNKAATNWVSTNSPGDVPLPALVANYNAYAGVPASDGSDAGVSFPVPGHGVGSVGDLGYVATGVASVPAAPWRSLRLQTNSSTATNTPPDWALLDLFSAPVLPRFQPGTNVTAGRINLNALLVDGANASRTNVLNALFTNAVFVPGNLPTVVSNVAHVRLASGGNFGQATNFTNFVSVGQLSEVPGVGDQGEAGEATLRKVASLATVRGGVFSVYSTGQAIQYQNGKVIVNGEKTVRALIERWFDGAGNPQYRILLWSEIYP